MEKISRKIILKTAQEIIIETKNSEVSLSQIANGLGVTHAAIYKYFESKQVLWEEVSSAWFKEEIIDKIKFDNKTNSRVDTLHSWLYQFANLKKNTYINDRTMFTLNTKYVDNHPKVLRKVLQPAYQEIDRIMDFNDPSLKRAEAILSAFAIFSLPTFKETWLDSDYQDRFDTLWNIIKSGL
ncbi:TetR/AcrR family transcriptional regulator [Weissella muntiaci]|uniref:TetR/AcrR family transcriptional regulator n=1 Tax=Weissella muntiaci TaxID=2508881 RepID=A0A6C2C1H3_9LACO|nr:TetR/AcrR family transcriptional regulator [Weissella muntiaci]TYC47838.1 TetR/AcrR family transcriptional regulator [Weissella muntiaci]